jgi:hypothetical protein
MTSMLSGLTGRRCRDPASRSKRSVRVIGYSYSRRAILTVILVRRDDGTYYGANGWESNPADQRRYREAQ